MCPAARQGHQRSASASILTTPALAGPTNIRAPARYNGPVYLRSESHTFAHTRMQQSTHK
jgi:hypothetical protein